MYVEYVLVCQRVLKLGYVGRTVCSVRVCGLYVRVYVRKRVLCACVGGWHCVYACVRACLCVCVCMCHAVSYTHLTLPTRRTV